MKQKIYDILRGRFLINEDAFKNWLMIIFLSVLALVMIASSHSAERKVHRIARMNDQVKELRSAYVDGRSRLMLLKMESYVQQQLVGRGLEPSENPPQKIIVKEKQE